MGYHGVPGVKLQLHGPTMMRSASRKLRNKLATSRSWRNRRWNSGRGSTFHAMVSVMAVKIQFVGAQVKVESNV